MEKQDLMSLLIAMLKEEIVGNVEVKNGEIEIRYEDGSTNTVTIK